MPTTLSILVFVASPLDYARYRHTALYFEFEQEGEKGRDSNTDDIAQIRKRGYMKDGTVGTDTLAATPTATDQSKRELEPTGNMHDSHANTTNVPVRSSVMEVVGSPGFFTFSERLNLGVPTSANLARIITVSKIPSSIPSSSIRDTISQTRILNGDGDTDWNSQNWVGDALARMVKAGYLNEEVSERGIDEMVDAILEAKDEELTRN
ncbi:uncharacterized protein N7483_007540 [Penicillium malachiteum]|uniref:uncharacterized protein n=1 Tax=Penicillium malachiteum TaxID=1324776 RepID=UPI0025473A76|nr:uncharacterized protein N7483_007540 [Penicillium malachiteum]KAJ5726183.1 hypothetical protein N7483_007540 [Penicillium malachiteum]